MKPFRLVIDPGHGMGNMSPSVYDPGATAGGVAEADIVLQWAKALEWIGVNEFGVNHTHIFLTREAASDLTPLGNRAAAARQFGASHFLSLHCNAGPILARGTETFTGNNPPVRDVRFAQLVQSAAVSAIGSRNRGIKPESQSALKSLAVLSSDFPYANCLLEIGFISNPSDRRRMLARDARVEFARQFWKEFLNAQS